MPPYLSPGVYVEEVSSGNKPIAGVGTSTAGFIGIAPGTLEYSSELTLTLPEEGEAVLCTNFSEFIQSFGDFGGSATASDTQTDTEEPDPQINGHSWLAHAVYGFFDNGGTRCFVARVTDANKIEPALKKFEEIDEIALVACPGITAKAAQAALITHCEQEALQDRFAILDSPQSPASIDKAGIQQAGIADSDYAAIYFPWIQVFDPAKNAIVSVPPSGHVAGIYGRVDATRGVFKAPANEVIRGALGVEKVVTKALQAGLDPEGINAIRKFDGTIKVWGARTLAANQDNEWKYINVRRLFLFLRESIDQGTQWAVFEPNDPALWAKLTRNITAFLTNVWRDGALVGSTPKEAFYVKCDAETNTQADVDAGRVITEIGVAVSKPAEFVIFRISQWSGTGS